MERFARAVYAALPVCARHGCPSAGSMGTTVLYGAGVCVITENGVRSVDAARVIACVGCARVVVVAVDERGRALTIGTDAGFGAHIAIIAGAAVQGDGVGDAGARRYVTGGYGAGMSVSFFTFVIHRATGFHAFTATEPITAHVVGCTGIPVVAEVVVGWRPFRRVFEWIADHALCVDVDVFVCITLVFNAAMPLVEGARAGAITGLALRARVGRTEARSVSAHVAGGARNAVVAGVGVVRVLTPTGGLTRVGRA